jgi:hypothetical protein
VVDLRHHDGAVEIVRLMGKYAELDASGKVPSAQLDGGTVAAHEASTDPHTGYQKESEKSAANGYASLGAGAKVPIAEIPTGSSATTVCVGDDARLSDARTPLAHTHPESEVTNLVSDLAAKAPTARLINTTAPLAGGGDLSADRTLTISDATTTAKGAVELATDGESAANVVVQGNDARMSNARTPTAHATSHQPGGGDAMAVDAAAATGSLRTLGTSGTTACAGNDARLSDARTPTAHATSHKSGGSDAIKLDELAEPTDITTLNADTTKHGLMQKYPGGTSTFLRADGTFAAAGGGGASATTVEKNLGSTPVTRGKFTITDAAISSTSKVMCWQAPGPYTGKGAQADEAEMAPVRVLSVEPAAGSAVVKWEAEGYVSVRPSLLGDYGKQNTVTNQASQEVDNPRSVLYAQRIGKVRGNVKFSYVVFA